MTTTTATATSTMLSPELRLYLLEQEHAHLTGAEHMTARHLLPFDRTLHLDACPACTARHTRRHGAPKYPRLPAEAG
jgi:hypothetical protein